MSKKVAIMGLNSLNNYGEKFIIKCVEHLLTDLEYTYFTIDFETKMGFVKTSFYYLIIGFSKIVPLNELKYKIIYFAVKFRCYSEYLKQLNDKDALIFAAGSFKYGTQKLWCHYSLAIEIAEKYGIPVMFNAMNLQKYNENDWRCRFLKKHVNYNCVKVFTTRDGEDGVIRFSQEYNTREKVQCSAVGDVAFWISDCYQVSMTEENDTIGINLINGNIFKRYGGKLTKEQLLDVYLRLLKLLDQHNQSWELYTNGLNCDYKFGEKLLRKYGNTNIEIKVPESDQELVHMISKYKKIIASRLHSCICAYAIGKPFVGFIWDEKVLHFSKMAKIEDCFIYENELSGNILFERLMVKEIELTKSQIDIREMWKSQTKEKISYFLELC